MDTAKILDLHKRLFELPNEKVSDEELINLYQQIESSIEQGLLEPTYPIFDA